MYTSINQESDTAKQFAAAILNPNKKRYIAAHDSFFGIDHLIEAGSKVDRLNKKTNGEYERRITDLAVAVDDILKLLYSNLLLPESSVSVAQFSLIRSAVECSSQAVWLLSMGTDNKTAFYTLHFAYKDLENLELSNKVFMTKETKSIVTLGLQVLEMSKNKIPNYKNHRIAEEIKISQVVMNADSAFKKARKEGYSRFRFNGEIVWRQCSAVNHGNTQAIKALSATTLVENLPDGKALFKSEKRHLVSTALTLVALENYEFMLKKFLQQHIR
jgi:hypothetical protein